MYNVLYDAPDGVRTYCVKNMSYEMACSILAKFKARYLNEHGTGKEYPNGRGFYPFTNPRIERMGD